MSRKEKILIPVATTLDGQERPLPHLAEAAAPGSGETRHAHDGAGAPRAPDHVAPPSATRSGIRTPSAIRWRLLGSLAALLLFLACAAAWKWTRLSELLDIDVVLGWTRWMGESPLAPLYVLAIYVLSGLVAFPVSILIVATALTFGSVTAFVYSMLGSLASAAALFLLGHLLGQQTVRRFAGDRVNRFNNRLARQGLYTIIALRVFPVGPYTLVNFMAGASEIRFRDYMLGTFVGMIPALVAVTIFGDRLGSVLRHPTSGNLLFLLAITLAFLGANLLLKRFMERRRNGPARATPGSQTAPCAGGGNTPRSSSPVSRPGPMGEDDGD